MQQKLRKRLKNERGLTLIELLAVIVILGIIAAIAIPSIGGIIEKSKVDAIKSDAIQVINGAKLYIAANGTGDGETTKITDTVLKNYVDKPKLDAGYYVTMTLDADGGAAYTINGSGDTGKTTITFTDAAVEDIDKETAKVSIIKK